MRSDLRPAAFLTAQALASLLHAQSPVLVPMGADADSIAELASMSRPSQRQVQWQQHGFVAFVHFGMNTFTDREWGDGTESPTTFAPTEFDARQWARTFADAGMRGIVLTCKHHDGFCLWPSASTDHDVAASPWRNGDGNVVAEVADACREHGLSFGVYLSPWDRNCKSFGTRAYHDVFQQQLRELCSDYGPLFEVWFDGAHCPSDDPQIFDWQSHFRLVRELQPTACIAITGPDVRWVGNEAGKTREQEWSALPLDDSGGGAFEQDRAAWQSLWRLREKCQAPDLGSRSALASARRIHWWPAETDVSIRNGWFYHASEDASVKPKSTLLDFWFSAVGGNAVLLLNVPPDPRGRIADADCKVLAEVGAHLRATFLRDIAADTRRRDSSSASEAWFGGEATFDVIDLREDVAAHGQRIESFRIDAWDGEAWSEIASGGTVGMRRLVRIEPKKARGVRCVITGSRGEPKGVALTVHCQPEKPK